MGDHLSVCPADFCRQKVEKLKGGCRIWNQGPQQRPCPLHRLRRDPHRTSTKTFQKWRCQESSSTLPSKLSLTKFSPRRSTDMSLFTSAREKSASIRSVTATRTTTLS